MNILYISGSPRRGGNTDYLLNMLRAAIGGTMLRLADYDVRACQACRDCRGSGECVLQDDMRRVIIPKLLQSDAVIMGTPVYYNNVSGQMKLFMDRTHCLTGLLRNKIGGAVVVGRKYGAEGAITAIHAFMLKHEMIPANRGVFGMAFDRGEIREDQEAIKATQRLGERVEELGSLLGK